MQVLDCAFTKQLIRMCNDGWLQGWHECHGGNLSYRLTEEEKEQVSDAINKDAEWIQVGTEVEDLAGDYLMVTASGQIFRNTEEKPEESLGLIEVSSDGLCYRILWGYTNGKGRPTSELPAHLLNQEVKKKTGEKRIIYHAHPENIIALSFLLPLQDEVFTRELWEMMPECAMIFPEGIGVVPWMVPGTSEIAKLTAKRMQDYNIVLWAQHGVFAAGKTPDETFGLVHTVEKAASILLKVLSVRREKRTVPSVKNMKEMSEVFNLDLPERFLFEKK